MNNGDLKPQKIGDPVVIGVQLREDPTNDSGCARKARLRSTALKLRVKFRLQEHLQKLKRPKFLFAKNVSVHSFPSKKKNLISID